MYFAVNLLDKTKLCIPASWLENINMVECFNNVFKRHEKRIVFFSSDECKEPKFCLPIASDFVENIDSCYYGYVLKAFENKELCIAYLNKRRGIAPPIYYPVRISPDNENILRNEITRQMEMDTKVQIKKEIDALRVALLNGRSVQSIDLTESDTEDYQNGIDDVNTIEDELAVLEEPISNENHLFDCLSGYMPFENTVRRKYAICSELNLNKMLKCCVLESFDNVNKKYCLPFE